MFSKAVCVGWTSLLMLLMSNIFDIIFVYFCAKAIEDQTEASKKMISKNEYVKRRRYVLTNDNTFDRGDSEEARNIWRLFFLIPS